MNASGRSQNYRALVCITTCDRPMLLARQLPHFAALTLTDPRFALLVAIDGLEPATLEFCARWQVPAVYSDEREGVGLSKNRALSLFPDFDYYFFIEDDVELVQARAFSEHVNLFQESGIHHFSLFERGGVRRPLGSSMIGGVRVTHCLFGSASFNFFTRESLELVGGWHPLFARYRRWGHTEHSYRVHRAGLAPAPFNVAESLAKDFIWHVPPAVTTISGVEVDQDQLAPPERELMDQRLSRVPLQTLSPVHFNGIPFGVATELAKRLDGRERYPLVGDTERRHARSDFDLWRFYNGRTLRERTQGLFAAVGRWPANPALRHALKTSLSK